MRIDNDLPCALLDRSADSNVRIQRDHRPHFLGGAIAINIGKMIPPAHLGFKRRDCSDSEFGRKANVCDEILTEARRLTRAGRFEAPLNQLIARACELLDEIDEILVTLRPSRDGREFGAAAALHRELEFVQDAFSASRLKCEPMPSA
jgi:hypothetical protein